MTGFLLTPDAPGCPPTETPPSDYENPFREDANGALWVRQCFSDLRYIGAARQDAGGIWPPPVIGDSGTPLTPFGQISTDATKGIKVGKYRNVTVYNDTPGILGLLVGLDMVADVIVRADHRVYMAVQSRWNGASHSFTWCSTPQYIGSTKMLRRSLTVSACPHDLRLEDDGEPELILYPGESGVVSAKVHIAYGDDQIPAGTERLIHFASAVRVYAYMLGPADVSKNPNRWSSSSRRY